MTKARKALLELLKESKEPVSASMLSRDPSLPFDQATIYRNLHYLEEKGFAESFILHCTEHGTERYYSYRSRSEGVHHHWFHCEKCHTFIDLGGCAYQEQMKDWEKQYGFSISDHTFFLTGICASCKS
ncbi:Fur family transcriptional regulator [uncultured Sphaerochaeta sp.]|uniref:Fur family transcriptional regulator n=1 Tax=uncultured Sphaerochaeta sp. TaxID=886478 RepID=UPI0029CA697D|nr:Fur family transcriptional regulator [uncultured Sphaerochaeta sp.]